MSDFLLSLESTLPASAALSLLQLPFGEKTPTGWSLEHSWGAGAVLADRIAAGQNRASVGGVTLFWVGDLVFAEGHESLIRALTRFSELVQSPVNKLKPQGALKQSGLLDHFSGAFAVLLVSDSFGIIITDPMASVQIYLGKDKEGRTITIGTHPDVVASATGQPYDIDPVSVCEFLNTGTSCCPFTMHRNVLELAPGTVLSFHTQPESDLVWNEYRYWTPPAEVASNVAQRELVEEFLQTWDKAVKARCEGKRVGVQLSGGFDSRVVLAAIPEEKPCLTVTLCDTLNREARFARRVAARYGREWIPLWRDAEYLGRTAPQAIRFTGCEGEWHHGHCIGFVERIAELEIDSIFTGLLMDNNFKGYYAQDIIRVGRFGGLLPASYKLVPVDYANRISAFCRSNFRDVIIEGAVERRNAFVQTNFALGRQSKCEWLDGYPLSQASDNTGWTVERRLLPLRIPVMDRRLVELAFKVPMSMKAGGGFFDQVASRILGPGRSIPSANDGVRPGSGHWSRLAQRSLRKVETSARRFAPKVGIKLHVPHSWHDCETYWRESSALEQLRGSHGDRLKEFIGTAFKFDPRPFLKDPATPWTAGSRLIQLATWRAVIEEYKLSSLTHAQRVLPVNS